MASQTYQACWEDLQSSDANGDGFLQSTEYAVFVRIYRQRLFGCKDNSIGVAEQTMNFNLLACEACRLNDTMDNECCVGERARIPLFQREQGSYAIEDVCDVTKAAVQPCPNASTRAPKHLSQSQSNNSSSTLMVGKAIILVPACIISLLLVLLLVMAVLIYRRRVQDGSPTEPEPHTDSDSSKDSCNKVVIIAPLDSEDDESCIS